MFIVKIYLDSGIKMKFAFSADVYSLTGAIGTAKKSAVDVFAKDNVKITKICCKLVKKGSGK